MRFNTLLALVVLYVGATVLSVDIDGGDGPCTCELYDSVAVCPRFVPLHLTGCIGAKDVLVVTRPYRIGRGNVSATPSSPPAATTTANGTTVFAGSVLVLSPGQVAWIVSASVLASLVLIVGACVSCLIRRSKRRGGSAFRGGRRLGFGSGRVQSWFAARQMDRRKRGTDDTTFAEAPSTSGVKPTLNAKDAAAFGRTLNTALRASMTPSQSFDGDELLDQASVRGSPPRKTVQCICDGGHFASVGVALAHAQKFHTGRGPYRTCPISARIRHGDSNRMIDENGKPIPFMRYKEPAACFCDSKVWPTRAEAEQHYRHNHVGEWRRIQKYRGPRAVITVDWTDCFDVMAGCGKRTWPVSEDEQGVGPTIVSIEKAPAIVSIEKQAAAAAQPTSYANAAALADVWDDPPKPVKPVGAGFANAEEAQVRFLYVPWQLTPLGLRVRAAYARLRGRRFVEAATSP